MEFEGRRGGLEKEDDAELVMYEFICGGVEDAEVNEDCCVDNGEGETPLGLAAAFEDERERFARRFDRMELTSASGTDEVSILLF